MKEIIIATTLALSCSLDVSEQSVELTKTEHDNNQEQTISPELQHYFKEFNQQRHLIAKMLHD